MRAPVSLAIGALACLATPTFVHAQTAPPQTAMTCAAHAPEAAARSGLSVDVIVRVMRTESGGNRGAVSPKGAMGCMQIMPATWRYLTRRHSLGTDPFHPRMNMIGGALYLAELVARFGLPGAYSAYNAGPARYQRYAGSGVPLPAETVAYTARLSGNTPQHPAAPLGPRWQEASLFITRPRTAPTGGAPVPVPVGGATTQTHSPVERAQPGLFPLRTAAAGMSGD